MAKLAVNIAEGLIEIEGDEKFVLSAFSEARAALKEMETGSSAPEKIQTTFKATPPPQKEEKGSGVKTKGSTGKGKTSKAAQPVLNANLDLTGLSGFVADHKPAKNTERILVFAAFLRDKLAISPCSFDDIFSCFHAMKSTMKIPQAFAKNMHDAKSEGFIEYVKLNEIEIPIMGENHLVTLTKKTSE